MQNSRLKAVRELGWIPISLFALYRVGLRIGYFRWKTPPPPPFSGRFESVFEGSPPDKSRLHQAIGPHVDQALAEADLVLGGQIRLFGGPLAPLDFSLSGPLQHWSAHETPQVNGRDVKYTWEPARFGWVFTLARAYQLTGDPAYPAAFQRYLEAFLENNPPYLGPNWANGQEVALRLMALAFAGWVFPETSRLADVVHTHARRIPPTLVYARAQNNNHLLSEAAGLMTAAAALPGHPDAARWQELGWHWFHRGLAAQIDPDGTYMQQSVNYHRLMLQLALWVNRLAEKSGRPFPEKSRARLAAAVRWLAALQDPTTGRVPNLGANDGAYILPFTDGGYSDYRPVLQAASKAFLGEKALEPGSWDEMGLWLHPADRPGNPISPREEGPATLQHPEHASWVYLRAARFHHRPGHADQLHLDIWWKGWNLASDPGTYLYNAAAPWENALTHARVHNTVTVNGQDQMQKAGRFLYVDRAQARLTARSAVRLSAEHDGYRRLGVVHHRQVAARQDGWEVTDELRPFSGGGRTQVYHLRLHWLLPDWNYRLSGNTLEIESPAGWVAVTVDAGPGAVLECTLARAGERLAGAGVCEPVDGWYSPTYGVKEAALSFAVTLESTLPCSLRTHWRLP
jgi:hypothetical protein